MPSPPLQRPEGSGRGAPPALLALGFRPFFLVAMISAIPLPVLWVLAYRGSLPLDTYYGAMLWHAHEMVFGYAAAVIAGFLLTSVRNWTGTRTLTGASLAALVGVWVAGRGLPFLEHSLPGWLIALVDLAFLPILAGSLAVPLLRRAPPRNMVFVPVLVALALANLLVHLGRLGMGLDTARLGVYLAVDLVVLLIAVVGGRVVPFFTERALPGATPVRRAWLEPVAIGSVVLLALVRLLGAPPWLLGGVAACAALAHGLRLAGWWDRGVASVPLLWVLHLGYAWLVLGMALTALGAAGRVSPFLALHALTTGAIGGMTLGMMARVALGHTGRALRPAVPTVLAFGAVNLAAFLRVVAPIFAPQSYGHLVEASVLLWATAFGLALSVYARILTRPRVDGRAG
jgi:uncharacterized protein involved in response to NO